MLYLNLRSQIKTDDLLSFLMHKKTSYTHCENFYCLMIEMSLKKIMYMRHFQIKWILLFFFFTNSRN